MRRPNHGEQKGRELNAPPLEAPRSALHESDIKPRPMGACSTRSRAIENSRFSNETRSRSYAIFLSFCVFTFVFSRNHKERSRLEEFAQELFLTGRDAITGSREVTTVQNLSTC